MGILLVSTLILLVEIDNLRDDPPRKKLHHTVGKENHDPGDSLGHLR